MIYLLLCIISSTAIIILFKYFDRSGINTFNAIITNYLTASLIGLIISFNSLKNINIFIQPWLPAAILIGILFVVMFNVIAITTQKAGISVSSVASKMSVIVPMLFSMLYYHEQINNYKIAGMVLAVIAVVFTAIRKNSHFENRKYLFLPLILFLGMGLVDSLVKFSQYEYLRTQSLPAFSTLLFTISAITGIIVRLFKKSLRNSPVNLKTVAAGMLLGIANFGTFYFLVHALNSNFVDSSIIFGLNSIGIVLLSVFLAIILFREKLSFINWTGIVLSIITIFVLTRA
jgi:drug/metabolite transporter (DMT)-like permease